jgi:hypothetical protein
MGEDNGEVMYTQERDEEEEVKYERRRQQAIRMTPNG